MVPEFAATFGNVNDAWALVTGQLRFDVMAKYRFPLLSGSSGSRATAERDPRPRRSPEGGWDGAPEARTMAEPKAWGHRDDDDAAGGWGQV